MVSLDFMRYPPSQRATSSVRSAGTPANLTSGFAQPGQRTAYCLDCVRADGKPVPVLLGDPAHRFHNVRVVTARVEEMTARPLHEHQDDPITRHSTGFRSLDDVLGGGMVRGSTVLLTGAPGGGKSTLLMGMLAECQRQGAVTYYGSGEEMAGNVRERAARANGLSVPFVHTQDLRVIARDARISQPHVVVLDSAQCFHAGDGEINTMRSVKEVGEFVRKLGHELPSHPVVFLVGQIVKDGSIAGPMFLKHMLDVHAHLEESVGNTRLVRCSKNRYGETGVPAYFSLRGGTMLDLGDITGAALEEVLRDVGSIVLPTTTLKSGRPIPIALEACVDVAPSDDGAKEEGRVVRISGAPETLLVGAVDKITTHTLVNLSGRDLRVEVSDVSGEPVKDEALELAICAALLAASGNVAPRAAVAGKISLQGKLRQCSRLYERVQAAASAGLKTFYGPPITDSMPPGITYVPCETLMQLALRLRTEPAESPKAKGEAPAPWSTDEVDGGMGDSRGTELQPAPR